jgi:hypothetical protein
VQSCSALLDLRSASSSKMAGFNTVRHFQHDAAALSLLSLDFLNTPGSLYSSQLSVLVPTCQASLVGFGLLVTSCTSYRFVRVGPRLWP